jgi:hypothetical protein
VTGTWSSRFRRSLGWHHSVPAEAGAFAALYAAYEVLRGLVAGKERLASYGCAALCAP